MTVHVESAELIEPWIYSTLTSDAQLTAAVGSHVYGALVPDDPGDLYVSIALLSLRDIRGVGRARFSTEAVYIVKAVGRTSSQDDLLPAAKRITALLDGVDADTAFGHITCVREATISYPEVSSSSANGGQAFLHLGAQLRVRASAP